jgi:hypothetical protein
LGPFASQTAPRARTRVMYFAAKKRVCGVQTFWRERKRVHKRKQQKVWGAGESGVARGPETEVVQDCQTIEKAVSCRGRVVGGAGSVAVCDIRPRHHIFLL